MHKTLSISEVLSRIFGYLAEDTVWHPSATYRARGTRKAERRALAVLARTCRVFSEPALDALWRRLDSLTPFLLCLPTYASDNTMDDDDMLPPFSEEEWHIVLRYAPRVRELTLKDEPLSMKILQFLWFRTTLLLPNLRKLHWNYEDYTTIGSIRLLLSPSLVHLSVRLDDGDHSAVLGLLERYHTLCPNLKSLHFGHTGEFPHVTAAISRAISCPPNLEVLACDSIDEAALIHIAESRCLKKLTATLKFQPEILRKLASYGTPDHPPFENLRILRLHVQDLSSFIPYLRAYHQPFEEVTLQFHVLPAPEVLHEFFTALGSASRQATLRRIKFRPTGHRSRARKATSSQPVDFHVLSPLMTFKLDEFDADLDNLVSLNDDELARLVQAWPDLETFYIDRRSGWGYPLSTQIPTLRGMLLLLARCPKLRALGMCVDARDIPSLTEDESRIRNMAITRLSFANSPIQEPVVRVAQFLLDHFPSLVEVQGSGWRGVNEQIQSVNDQDCSRDSSDSDGAWPTRQVSLQGYPRGGYRGPGCCG